MERTDKDRAWVVRKWGPVLQSLEIAPGKKQETLAGYAEHHNLLDNLPRHTCSLPNNYVPPVPYGAGTAGPTDMLLPYSMKLASQLTNIDFVIKNGRIILVDESVNPITFRLPLTAEDQADRQRGIDIISRGEKALLAQAIATLNSRLKTCSTVTIYKLVSQLYLDSPTNTLILVCDLKMEGTRAEKLARILK